MVARAPLQVVIIPLATLILGLGVILFGPLDPTGRLSSVLARAWSRLLCLAAGVRVETEGLDHLNRHNPAVLVSNHASLFDPPALLLALARPFHFIAKRSLFLVPVFGQAIWAAGIIPIDRGNRTRAVASMDRAVERVRRGATVLVFAEGTRSRDGHLQPLKKGAFILAIQAGVPILPVAVTGSRQVLPKGNWLARPGTIHVRVLPAIETTGLVFDDRDRLRDQVAQVLRSATSLPLHSRVCAQSE